MIVFNHTNTASPWIDVKSTQENSSCKFTADVVTAVNVNTHTRTFGPVVVTGLTAGFHNIHVIFKVDSAVPDYVLFDIAELWKVEVLSYRLSFDTLLLYRL